MLLKIARSRPAMVLAALAAAVTATPGSTQALKPLDVEDDFNGVDVLSGEIRTRPPAISLPGAGNLRFQRLGDLQPILFGKLVSGSPDNSASYDLNFGHQTSEHFDCNDNMGCRPKKANGSALLANPGAKEFEYYQGGTGMVISFTLQNNNQGPLVGGAMFQFYATSISYADGETHTFNYDLFNDPTYGVLRRPTSVVSNRGYTLTLTYQTPWPQGGWQQVLQATMYKSDDMATPLARLSYNSDGSVITDLAGRVYSCSGCSNWIGAKSTVPGTTLQLPGETVNTLVATSAPCGTGNVQKVNSVTSDGAAYTYVFTPTSSLCQYLNRAVITGPLSFSRTVNMSASASIRPRVTSVVDSQSRTTSYTYDNDVRVTRVTYPEGNYVNVIYDGIGNITERRLRRKTNSTLADIVETASYPLTATCVGSNFCLGANYFRPAWTRDAKNQQTDYTWATNGNLLTKLEPADAEGRRRKTINEYDGPSGTGRLLRERICSEGTVNTCGTAAEEVRELTYWGLTLLPLTETRRNGTGTASRTITYSYDMAGRQLSADGPLAGTDDATYARYDTAGRRTWEIGPRGANGYRLATRTTYRDADDQPLTVEKGYVVNPTDTNLVVKSTESTTYNSRRLAIDKRMAASGTTLAVSQMSYDARNRASCSTVRMNPAIWASLPVNADACALQAQGSDGPDRITRTSYDPESRVLTIEKAVGTPIAQTYVTYTYSNNGKRISVKDANNNLASMTYDGHDRQTRWSFPSTTTPNTVNTADYEEYGYDANGNRTSLRRRDGRTLTFTYDAVNRMTSKLVADGCFGGVCPPATATRDVFYTYDIQGRQLTAKFDSSGGTDGITSAYDLFGNLTSSTIAMGGFSRTLGAQYDAHNNRTSVTHPDSQSFTYSYDAADRMGGAFENGSASLFSQSFNAFGERSAMGRGGSSSSFSYDGASRITGIGHDLFNVASQPSPDVNWTFGYNPASQLASQSRDNDSYAWTGAAAVTRPYTVNGLNQYTGAGGTSFTYDLNGNLRQSIAGGTDSYVYDGENRLVSANVGGQAITLTYDPMGRLWQVSGPTSSTRFLYDGDELAAEYDGAGALLRRYVHGNAVDDPMVWYEGSGVGSSNRRQLFTDRQGSVIAVADGAGTPIATNSYDEYGIPGATNQGRFQYTGQIWLPEIGMYHYKARLYSPTLGRFLQTDPVGYDDQINLYSYVMNDPMNGTDPDGMYNCPDTDCKTINSYMRQLQKAAATPETGTRIQSAALNALVKHLGTENDGNKVNIRLGDVNTPRSPGNASFDGKTTTITLDSKMIRSAGHGAVILSHEGVHSAQFLSRGHANSYADVTERERHAYWLQGKVAQKLGISDRTWYPGITKGERLKRINSAAYDSCLSVEIEKNAFPATGCKRP